MDKNTLYIAILQVDILQSAKEEYEIRQSSKLDSPSISGHSWWQTIKSLLSLDMLDENTSIPALSLDNGEAQFLKTTLNRISSTNIFHPNAN